MRTRNARSHSLVGWRPTIGSHQHRIQVALADFEIPATLGFASAESTFANQLADPARRDAQDGSGLAGSQEVKSGGASHERKEEEEEETKTKGGEEEYTPFF